MLLSLCVAAVKRCKGLKKQKTAQCKPDIYQCYEHTGDARDVKVKPRPQRSHQTLEHGTMRLIPHVIHTRSSRIGAR